MVANLSNERGGRRRGRAKRSPPGAQRFGALPPVDNPLPPIEVLDAETLARIINAAFRLIEEAGLEFRSERVLTLLKANGAIVEKTQIARMGRDIVEHFVKLAPSRIELHARNPERSTYLGGNRINFNTVGSPPNI